MVLREKHAGALGEQKDVQALFDDETIIGIVLLLDLIRDVISPTMITTFQFLTTGRKQQCNDKLIN